MKANALPMEFNGSICGYAPAISERNKKHKMFVDGDNELIMLDTEDEALNYANERLNELKTK